MEALSNSDAVRPVSPVDAKIVPLQAGAGELMYFTIMSSRIHVDYNQ